MTDRMKPLVCSAGHPLLLRGDMAKWLRDGMIGDRPIPKGTQKLCRQCHEYVTLDPDAFKIGYD